MEMSQPGWKGTLRVATLYIFGVVGGCLAASIIDTDKYLVGASAGVYALITAHLGNNIPPLFLKIGGNPHFG